MKAVAISVLICLFFACKKETIEEVKPEKEAFYVQVVCKNTEWYYQILNKRYFYNSRARNTEIVTNMGTCNSQKQILGIHNIDSVILFVMPKNEKVVINIYRNDIILFSDTTEKLKKITWQF